MHPTTPERDRFLDPLAIITLILFVLGVVWTVPQIAVVAWLGKPDWSTAVDPFSGQNMTGFLLLLVNDGGILTWLVDNALLLSIVQLLVCVLGCAACWGLRQRQSWARHTFIWLLIIGAVANFVGLWPLDAMFSQFFRVIMDLDSSNSTHDVLQRMQVQRMTSLGTVFLGAVALAVLHGWLVIKLMSAPVVARFRR